MSFHPIKVSSSPRREQTVVRQWFWQGHGSPATARRALPSDYTSCDETPPLSPGQTPEIDDAFLWRWTQTRQHHGAINRQDNGTAWLFDDEAPRKGEPAQT